MTKTLLFSEYYVTVCIYIITFHIVSILLCSCVSFLFVYFHNFCISMRHLCSLCFYTGVQGPCAVF